MPETFHRCFNVSVSASEMTYIVSSGALNSTHSLTQRFRFSVLFQTCAHHDNGIWTFRTIDYSYNGLFVPCVDHSYHRLFQMVHGMKGLWYEQSVVRIVNGTKSLVTTINCPVIVKLAEG